MPRTNQTCRKTYPKRAPRKKMAYRAIKRTKALQMVLNSCLYHGPEDLFVLGEHSNDINDFAFKLILSKYGFILFIITMIIMFILFHFFK